MAGRAAVSAATPTLSNMSSRIRSDFGALADRRAPGAGTHFVEVLQSGELRPGLLVDWIRGADGWSAQVAWLTENGQLIVDRVPGNLVRPAHGVRPADEEHGPRAPL